MRSSRAAQCRRGRRGIALVLVLLVVTILMILVLEFHFNTRITARISSNVTDDLKAYYLAKSGIHVAAKFLIKDKEDSNEDNLDEDWAKAIFPIPAGEGQVLVSIVDENTKININRLVRRSGKPDSRIQGQFEQLLQILGLDPILASAFIDWIDEDTNHLVTGAYEDSTYGYNSTDFPYTCKNHPFDTAGEMSLLSGVNQDVYKILSPYVSIYSGRKLNINTADATLIKAVLLAVDPGADENIANQIVEHRAENPFKRSSMRRVLMNELGLERKLASGLRRYLVTRTNTFHITANATVNEVQKKATAIVRRKKGDYKILYWRVD